MAFDFPSGVDLDDGYQVINPETGATYRWKEDPGKWVLVTPLSSAAGRRPIFAPSEPSEHPDYNAPDSNLQIGDIWYDTSDELAQHIWDGGDWVAVDERYVQVKGDVMTGPLLMNDGDELDPQPLKIDADDQAVHKIYVDSLKAHIYVGEKGPDTDELPIGTLWYDNDENDLTLYLWTGKEWTTAAPPVSTDGAVVTLQGEVEQALAAANRADNRSASNQSAIIEVARAIGNIQDSLGQVTLEEVLENGNIADKSIVLTNATDDVLLLSPEEARIMVGGKEDVIPKIELRHTKGVLDTSLVALELDEDGKRFDIECDERVDNIHFRFNDDDKLVLNKEGDAIFGGRVQVEPGIEGNEAVTYNQLVEIEEELESIVPSIERGQFDLLLRNIEGGDEGYFNMLRPFNNADKREREEACDAEKEACIRNPNIDAIDCESDHDRCLRRIPNVGTGHYPTDEFADVIRLKFSFYDVDGVTHNWESLKAGQLIDVFNMEDDSYMLAEVLSTQGMWYEGVDINVKVLQYKGKATGRCRIKVFELDLNAGSDVDFVRKQGTNKVENNWKITSDSKTHFHVQDNKTKIYWLQDPSSDQHPVTLKYANNNYFRINEDNETTGKIWIRPKNSDGEIKGGAGIGNMLVVNQESGNQGSIVRIQQNGEDCLKVEVNKRVNMFHNIVKDLGDPRTNDDGKKDAANRDYVDNKVASINSLNDAAFGRKFKYAFNSTDPRDGDGYCYFGSNFLYVSIADLDELKYHINGDTYSDREVTGSGQKHPIMICQQNADGVWELIGSGHWPGKTDSRSGYIYVKGVTWTRSNFVKGTEYRIKLSPFW